MERITEVTRGCVGALIQLRRADGTALPPAETVRTRMTGLIDEMLDRAAQLGFVQSDCQDIAYAVVALIDEVAMSKPEVFRQAWMRQLLQLQYFRENTAGDGFFDRLQEIRIDPQRVEVLRAYHLCLLLGFQGCYRVRGGEIDLLRLTEELGRALRPPETISPHIRRPPKRRKTPRMHLYLATGAVLACALLFYAGIRFSLSSTASSVVSSFTTASGR